MTKRLAKFDAFLRTLAIPSNPAARLSGGGVLSPYFFRGKRCENKAAVRINPV